MGRWRVEDIRFLELITRAPVSDYRSRFGKMPRAAPISPHSGGRTTIATRVGIGLGSYKTAWYSLHKLRGAMTRLGRDCLTGEVVADETYVGGPEQAKRGREFENKAIVEMAEQHVCGTSRIPMRRVKGVWAGNLLTFVQAIASPGAIVHNDGWSGYSGLAAADYHHQIRVISASSDFAHVVMPRIYNADALLKRPLPSIFQHRIQHQQLDYCLDEFAFRFNSGKSWSYSVLFRRPVRQTADVGLALYSDIINQNDSTVSTGSG